MLELRKGFTNLTKQHKTAMAKIDRMREERQNTRAQLSEGEKKNSLLKRKVAALNAERDNRERERDTERAHIRK